jgi:hypothetical protein
MNWLYRLLGLGPKELPAAPPIHEAPAIEVAETYPGIQDIFLDTIQEVHDETYKLERELLDDAKLRGYIKNTIRAIMPHMTDRYEFVLIHPSDVNINEKIWATFCQIMIGLFKTIDLPATNEGTYMKLMKDDIKKSFGALKKSTIDIDERMRAMLSQGIYR